MTKDIDLDALQALAEKARWTGEWYDAGCGTVMCTYADDSPWPGETGEIAHPEPVGTSAFIAATNPQTILSLIARIRELEGDTGKSAEAWQPIETAPKDGSPVILAVIEAGQLFDVDHGYFEVLADDEEDGPWDIRGGEPWCSYEGRAAGTYFCCWLPGKELDTRCRVTEDFPYTHWMAAPSAGRATPEGGKP